MKTVETTRMELFETWFKVCQQARLNRGFDEYTNWEVTLMTMAFNAALMSRDELIEHLREEIKALKVANLDLQIHFDTMKAELEEANSLYIVIPEREDCEDDRKHPNSWTDYAIGWNACRRETKRLNSDKETK